MQKWRGEKNVREDKWIQRKEQELSADSEGCEKTAGTRKKLIANYDCGIRFILTYFTRALADVNARSCITPLRRQGVLLFCRVRMTRMAKPEHIGLAGVRLRVHVRAILRER